MGKYPIIFVLEWVPVIIGHIGNADLSVLFSPCGCDFNLHNNHFGAVLETEDEGQLLYYGAFKFISAFNVHSSLWHMIFYVL